MVQHFGAEVRKLGGFFVSDLSQDTRSAYRLGVGAEHSVHVGPDPQLIGIECRGENGAGIIRASTAKRGADSVFRGAQETCNDGRAPGLGQRQQMGAGGLAGGLHQQARAGEVIVGNHTLGAVHRVGRDAFLLEEQCHEIGREPFTDRQAGVHGPQWQLAEQLHAGADAAKLAGDLHDNFLGSILAGAGGEQGVHCVEMFLLQVRQPLLHGSRIAGNRGAGCRQQRLRDGAHGGHHHHYGRLLGARVGDDLFHTSNGVGTSHGSAAKLHYQHRFHPKSKV